ncbi:MAG: hypothetical protein R2857_15400 [Vampirovibrionales bacterium]
MTTMTDQNPDVIDLSAHMDIPPSTTPRQPGSMPPPTPQKMGLSMILLLCWVLVGLCLSAMVTAPLPLPHWFSRLFSSIAVFPDSATLTYSFQVPIVLWLSAVSGAVMPVLPWPCTWPLAWPGYRCLQTEADGPTCLSPASATWQACCSVPC